MVQQRLKDQVQKKNNNNNFMDDGFSAKKKRASEFFFSEKNVCFPKNRASEEASIIFFQKTDFPQKGGEGRSELFFQRKQTNTDMIFRLEKKLVSPDKNGAEKFK